MDAEQIVRALAAADPLFEELPEGLPPDGYDECTLCRVVTCEYVLKPSGLESDEVIRRDHDPGCPWRLAREWVAANPS